MANIKQVAGLAGLSVSCVSKYLKNPDSVLPSSRERIEAAIETLHYSPSTAARSLRTKRSYTVKAVMESITNPFYAEIFENLRSELERYGYTVVLQTCDGKGFREIDFDAFDGVVACFLDREDTLRQIIRLTRDKLAEVTGQQWQAWLEFAVYYANYSVMGSGAIGSYPDYDTFISWKEAMQRKG